MLVAVMVLFCEKKQKKQFPSITRKNCFQQLKTSNDLSPNKEINLPNAHLEIGIPLTHTDTQTHTHTHAQTDTYINTHTRLPHRIRQTDRHMKLVDNNEIFTPYSVKMSCLSFSLSCSTLLISIWCTFSPGCSAAE